MNGPAWRGGSSARIVELRQVDAELGPRGIEGNAFGGTDLKAPGKQFLDVLPVVNLGEEEDGQDQAGENRLQEESLEVAPEQGR